MSISRRITEWKGEAEIDYLHPFIALWVAFDIWLIKDYKNNNQRESLEKLKDAADDIAGSEIYKKLKTYLNDTDNKDPLSLSFKSNFILLSNGLSRADIFYDSNKDKSINFQDGLLERALDGKPPVYLNIFTTKNSKNKIKISNDIFLIDDVEKIYKIYLESLYLIRCKLFHGELELNKDENKLVVKYLYLTLKDLMVEI